MKNKKLINLNKLFPLKHWEQNNILKNTLKIKRFYKIKLN